MFNMNEIVRKFAHANETFTRMQRKTFAKCVFTRIFILHMYYENLFNKH